MPDDNSLSDLSLINGRLYGVSTFDGPDNIIIELDAQTGEFVREVYTLPEDTISENIILPGLTTVFDNACDGQLLIFYELDLTTEDLFRISITVNSPELVLDTLCLGTYDRFGASFNLASWEPHRQTCELRLDLDDNDSQGRAGPHHRPTPTCTELSAIADEDASIWSVDDRPLDSLIVRLLTAEAFGGRDSLRYTSAPNLRIITVGDTLLKVLPASNSAPTYEDYTDWLKDVRVEIGTPRLLGERRIEVSVHAGEWMSDVGISFLDVFSDQIDAGPDQELVACRGRNFSLRTFQDRSIIGGRFEPGLPTFDDGSYYFNSDSLAYGTYLYIRDQDRFCIPDTANYTFSPPPRQAMLIPEPNDTVYICGEVDLDWDPVTPPGVTFLVHENDQIGRVRRITEPGTYRALVRYRNVQDEFSPCREWLSFTVIRENEPFVALDTTLCPATTLALADTLLTTSGHYTLRVSGPGCDTLYDLTLTVLEQKDLDVFIDTARCDGAPVFLAGTLLTEAGDYQFRRPLPGGCEIVTDVRLRYGGTTTVIDTAVRSDVGLAVADTLLFLPGEYEFTLTDQYGCDSLLSVSLDIINTVRTPAALGHRVVNPIPHLSAFRLLDGRGRAIHPAELVFFTATGRRVRGVTDIPGLYFFRYRLREGEAWTVGKVVVR